MEYNINISERTFHFREPAGTSRGVYTTRHSFFVNISSVSNPDVFGIGECAPLPRLSCDYLPDYEKILIDEANYLATTGNIDIERLKNYPSILFGFETAILQLKAGGSYSLFDTPFSKGKEGIPINGLIWMGTFDQMKQRLDEKIARGSRCIKFKVGAIDFQDEKALIKYARSLYNKEKLEIRLDANGGFSPENALERLKELSEYDIHSIEQPIMKGQWSQMAYLCEKSPIPIAFDEELIGINDFKSKKELLENLHPSYIVLKPSLYGGMSGVHEWIKLASQYGIGSWITSALESNVGLNMVAQLAAKEYGTEIKMPQGLGTGLLYSDNIKVPIKVEDNKLWCCGYDVE